MGVLELVSFNTLPVEQAAVELTACCAAPAWVRRMVAGRPYPDPEAVWTSGAAALTELDWEQIAQALAAHPRIGQRATGGSRESVWSRREQAGMDRADERVRAELRAANLAYEERFGHLFLIFASGRTDTEMLAAARQRLANDPATERSVVRAELANIVALRLRRLLS